MIFKFGLPLKKISVIIINYNGKHLLKPCLESLFRQSLTHIEIILVDNASRDGSLAYVRDAFPDVKIIALKTNVGFAAANNKGLKHTSGKYVMLLNNDTETNMGCIENLYAAMEANPDIGIGAPKMLVCGKDIIDSAGDGFSMNLKGFKRGEGEKEEKYDQEEYIFGACAGAALYRRKMLEEIGFFDEDFFLIHEDTDLNLRAQLAGWKVMYVPTAVVYHKVRSTIGHMSDDAVYFTLRNSELMRLKNIPFIIFLRCLPEFLAAEIADFLYFAVKHGKFRQYVKAKIDVLRALKRTLNKRKYVMQHIKVNTSYLFNMMTPVWQKEFIATKMKKIFTD